MTDQTECRPGTIATITLPADMAVVSAIVAGVVRTLPEVRAVQHGGHLDLCGPGAFAPAQYSEGGVIPFHVPPTDDQGMPIGWERVLIRGEVCWRRTATPPATAAQDGQERPVSASEDSGTCGGSCDAAQALRRDVRELTDALGESNDARVRMLAKVARMRALADEWASSPAVGGSSSEQWEFDTLRGAARDLYEALDGGTGATR